MIDINSNWGHVTGSGGPKNPVIIGYIIIAIFSFIAIVEIIIIIYGLMKNII